MGNSLIACPRISVIVSTYNRAALLKGCLQSLVVQTSDEKLFEVIVVNNNSSDGTQQVAEEFTKKQSNFRVVIETRQGLSHARNRGYTEAHGEYVAYIDDDAKADRRWVENIIVFINRHPDIVAFGGPYKSFSLVEIPKWYKKSYCEWSLGEEARPITKDEWINGTNMVYKRSLLVDMGGFNTKVGMSGDVISYGEETNLLIKVKEMGQAIYYVPDMVVEHLVADYKLSLRWMLKSNYLNGFSGIDVFHMQKRPLKQLLITVYFFLRSLEKVIFSKEGYLKARIVDSFSPFFYNLGSTVGMFRE